MSSSTWADMHQVWSKPTSRSGTVAPRLRLINTSNLLQTQNLAIQLSALQQICGHSTPNANIVCFCVPNLSSFSNVCVFSLWPVWQLIWELIPTFLDTKYEIDNTFCQFSSQFHQFCQFHKPIYPFYWCNNWYKSSCGCRILISSWYFLPISSHSRYYLCLFFCLKNKISSCSSRNLMWGIYFLPYFRQFFSPFALFFCFSPAESRVAATAPNRFWEVIFCNISTILVIIFCVFSQNLELRQPPLDSEFIFFVHFFTLSVLIWSTCL